MAPQVAQFPEYLEPLAGHLLWVKARHWEKAMRELAAAAAAGECSCMLGQRWPLLLCTMPLTHIAILIRERLPCHAALAPISPAYFVGTALPRLLPLCTDPGLEVRHGAMAMVAELLPALR